MKLVFLTPGAGGWYCGACMRDNALVTSLQAAGHDVSLLPMYLPLHLDEPAAGGVDQAPMFFGGINVFLRQKLGWFRHVPVRWSRWLDRPWLLRRIARSSQLTEPGSHGAMTLAMLRLEETRLSGELDQLVAWLAAAKPDLLCLSTVLQAGLIRSLKERLGIPILCSFQGEDSFLDGLPEPYRTDCWRELAARVGEADALVAPSRFYAELMNRRLGPGIPEIHVIPNGIRLGGFPPGPPPVDPPVIGFFARLCKQKGLELMVDAFIHLRCQLGHPTARLHLAGAVTAADQPLMAALRQRLAATGLADDVRWQVNPNHEEKAAMLSSLSLFSVPAIYPEACGLYLLEALAAGVPVVQPESSAFPEILAAAGTGRLVEPNNPAALATAWHDLLRQPAELRTMAAHSRAAAERHFGVELMKDRFLALAGRVLGEGGQNVRLTQRSE